MGDPEGIAGDGHAVTQPLDLERAPDPGKRTEQEAAPHPQHRARQGRQHHGEHDGENDHRGGSDALGCVTRDG